MQRRFLFGCNCREPYHCRHSMDLFDRNRFGYLRDQLARARAERLMLDRALQSPSRSSTSKRLATHRYSSLDAEIRIIVSELEDCLSVSRDLAATKRTTGRANVY